METYFVDTSYWLALVYQSDQNHQLARLHQQQLRSQVFRLMTTSFVFDEAMAFLNSRGQHANAVQLGQQLLNSPGIDLIYVDESLFLGGWSYFQQHHDKRYSLTDCISFVFMHQHSLQTALAFDHHFTQAGFQHQPQ